jgi:hypothetical protein
VGIGDGLLSVAGQLYRRRTERAAPRWLNLRSVWLIGVYRA